MRFLLSILAFSVGLTAYSSHAHAIQNFQFIEWQNCSEKIVCKTIKPKSWKASEITVLNNILDRFENGGLLNVIDSIQKAGYISFQRIQRGYATTQTALGTKAVRADLGVWAFATVNSQYPTIAITDKFFKSEMIDPYSGVNIQEIYLLHEMAHAFDNHRKLSWDPEFLKLTKFDAKGFYAGISYDQYRKLRYEDVKLEISDNNPKEAFKYQRETGMSLGLPRLYSMSLPDEAFADLVAFIYLDPNAPNYIDKKLIQYIDKNVLHGARR